MKTIKLGCLERTRLSAIESARDLELVYLRRDSFFWSVMAFLASVSTILVTTLTIGLYVALEEHNFSASDIFTTLALLGQLSVCLSVFPVTVPIFIKGIVSRDRLHDFFQRPEVSHYRQRASRSTLAHHDDEEEEDDDEEEDDEEEQEEDINDTNNNDTNNHNNSNTRSTKRSRLTSSIVSGAHLPGYPPLSKSKVAFELASATFSWPLSSTPTLSKVDLIVKQGTLTVVVGGSGSGKSALLAALVGEMRCHSGQLHWHLASTRVAFTGQRPWLMNASIRDNVLMGRPLKEKRYRKVLQACDLITDIDLLPMGDETEVGERGVLLSGGQRQRLAIARCLYSRACCTVLDAPFSALDANIARHVFEQGVMGLLLKRRRTVVMATDRLDLLSKAQHVVLLRDGEVIAQGSLQQVKQQCPPDICLEDNGLREDDGNRTANERWRLLRNVTRWSLRLKQRQQQGMEGRPSLNNTRNKTLSIDSGENNNLDFSLPKAHKNSLGRVQSRSSSRLNRQQWARMDSSSQLNLCHDIMLASDECSVDNFSTASEDPEAMAAEAFALRRHQIQNRRSSRGGGSRNRGQASHAPFSRASSWSTSLSHHVLHRLNSAGNRRGPTTTTTTATTTTSTSTTTSTGSGPSWPRGRRTSRNASSSSLLRGQPSSGSSSSVGSRPLYRPGRMPSSKSQFERMRSFQLTAVRNRLRSTESNGSTHSLPKTSTVNAVGTASRLVDPDFSSSITDGGVFSSRQSSVTESTPSRSGGGVRVESRPMSPMNRMISISSAISGFSDDLDEDEEDTDELSVTPLLLNSSNANQEKRGYGSIRTRVYKLYLTAGGPTVVSLFLLLSLTLQVLKVKMDFLLRDWSLQPSDTLSVSYFYSYSSLSLVALLVSCLANLMGQLMGARARSTLHSRMLENLLKCPLELFETYPMGRIMARFSYDLFIVDQKLPSCIQRLVLVALICGSALAVNVLVSKGLFLIFVLPMLILYYWLQHFYRCTSRELQRLDSISRAPIFSHLNDTLGGLVTLRAFAEETRFVNELCDKMDNNAAAFLVLQSACRWLGVTLDITGALMVLVSVLVHLFFTSMDNEERVQSSRERSSTVGLTLNYSLLVPIYLAWVVKFLSDIENHMNAVERIVEYAELQTEDMADDVDNVAKNSMLSRLRDCSSLSLRLEGVGVAHSLDVRAVVHNVSLLIRGGEKVGICGRSGSGKSTLLSALPRVAKIVYGHIKLEDVDIDCIPLPLLRKLVLTVPQDVTLFSGTVRSNLDPENRASDESLWATIDQLELRPLIQSLDKGLDSEVGDNGDNFSQSQRQELSLARALLLKPPVLLLDETTSALDPSKELHIHKLLLGALRSSTIITVAHRLASLVHYDRVLVMGEGRVLEDGKPRDLLKKPMGFFSALWRAAGHSQQHYK